MSKDEKDKDMALDELLDAMPEELREILGDVGFDEKIKAMRKHFKIQQSIIDIIDDLEPNEAVGCLLSILTSVIGSGSKNLSEALAATSRIQSTIVEMLESSDRARVAPWYDQDDDVDDSFDVKHPTKQ